MSVNRSSVNSYRLVRLGALGLAVALILLASMAVFDRAFADGGVPATATLTPSATATVTPTNVFILIATDTQVPQLLLPATNTPVSDLALPAYPLVTPRAPLGIITEATPGPTQVGPPLVCWALPLAVIIVFIIVASSLGVWRKYHPA